ncbi:MAG: hypothetical protein QM775_03085 [Pirellulales bacterium]
MRRFVAIVMAVAAWWVSSAGEWSSFAAADELEVLRGPTLICACRSLATIRR